MKPATLRSAKVEYIAITSVITKIKLTNITFSMTNASSIFSFSTSNFQSPKGPLILSDKTPHQQIIIPPQSHINNLRQQTLGPFKLCLISFLQGQVLFNY